MVERGGLNYPIRVRDEFSKTTALFRKEIRASKKEFRSFQSELRKGRSTAKGIRETAAATKKLAQAQAQLAKASRATRKPLTDEEKLLRRLAQAQKEQTAREREAVRLRSAQRADARAEATRRTKTIRAEERAAKAKQKAQERAQKERDRVDPVKRAARRVAALELENRTIVRQIALLRARGAALIAGGDITAGASLVREAKRLEKTLKGSVKQANSLFFTFRRLVGTLAIFTLARKGVQAFNELISAGVRFNDTIEASTLGIGGLVATLGDVRDGLGQSVGQAEELDLALGIARKQIELLRQDSLRTVATFSQLLDTFQVAVGPGLAAGLDLDEIRQLTVQISQAATALSVPQNQLAEEIRSLLAGTIQARTTRIATALGITNADIRRLKETGELFEFLQERLEGFSEAAQRAARQTISGLQALLKGAFEALVGEAAKPLFDELVSLSNDLLDNVLTITDEFGNLQPNPEAVEALQTLFDALRDGVVAAREFAVELGFEGLKTTIGAVGVTLRVLLGIIKSIAATFGLVIKAVTFVRDLFGLTNLQVGLFAGFIAQAGTALFVLRKALALVGLDFKKLLNFAKKLGPVLLRIATNPLVLVSAGFIAILKITEKWFEKLSGVDLSLSDTIKLINVGLLATFEDVLAVIELIIFRASLIGKSPKEGGKALLDQLRNLSLAFGAAVGTPGAEKLLEERLTEEAGVDPKTRKLKDETEFNRLLREGTEAILSQFDARKQARAEQVAAIFAEAEARKDADTDADKDAPDVFDPSKVDTGDFEAIVSTADKPIADLSTSLLELEDNLRRVRAEFAQGIGAEGLGGQLQDFFREEDLESGERLRTINVEIAKVQERIATLKDKGFVTDERIFAINEALKKDTKERIAALKELDLSQEEAIFISLLTDQRELREGLADAEKTSFDLAVERAAVLAQQTLPSLREQTALLNAQLAAEQALTAAALTGAGPRQIRLIAARNAVSLAREELIALVQRNQAEIAAATSARNAAAEGSKERTVLQETLDLLLERVATEQEILGLKTAQLEKEREIAELIESGTALQGARQGLIELAGELPSIFEVGLNLAKTFVTSFANFAATEIVNAIVNAQQEGVDRSELFKQAAGRFAKELATQILQQVIQNLIGLLLQATVGRAAVEATSATTAANIRVLAAIRASNIEVASAKVAAGIRAAGSAAGHEGGFVQGFAYGGPVSGSSSRRPRGLHPADTVPAWLAPGEFVMRRAAVQALGLPALTAMNGGNMGAMGSGSAEAAGPALGMQAGGLVSERTTVNTNEPPDQEDRLVVVPAIAANDREMDQLTAGGRNAMLSFMRENSGDINTLLDRGAGRG